MKRRASTSTDPSAKPALLPEQDLIEASKDEVHSVQRGSHNENYLRLPVPARYLSLNIPYKYLYSTIQLLEGTMSSLLYHP